MPVMKRYLKKIAQAESTVVGINRRNIELVYPSNPRKEFRIADDKAWFKEILGKEGIPVPATITLIEHLWEVDEKLTELEQREEVVIKPARGSGGSGILILQRNATGWYTPDGQLFDRERIRMHIASILYGAYTHDHADKALVEERLTPHTFLRSIYPEGVPDVRLILYHDDPVMAMLRVPTRQSKGKANLHQGAIGIGMDLESGILGFGMYRGRQVESHPDSGALFRGLVLPEWKKFIRIGVRTASLVPLKFLGIDLILDANRGPLVIEINARPGLQIQNSNRLGLQEAIHRSKRRQR